MSCAVGGLLTGDDTSVHCDSVAAVPVAGGRTLLATAGESEQAVRLWDPVSRRQLCQVDLPGQVGAVCALPHGRLVVGFGCELAVVDFTGN